MRYLWIIMMLAPVSSMAVEVSEVNVVQNEEQRISAVTIKGSGFGEKAAPLLFDKASHAYERGVLNDSASAISDGGRIEKEFLQGNDDTVWQSAGGYMYLHRDSEVARYRESRALYYGETGDANLHNPRVWPRSGTDTEEDKIYVSWWFRQKNDTRSYFEFELANFDDEFDAQEDDTFTVDVGDHWSGVTEVKGRVVHWDREANRFHAVYLNPLQPNANRIAGKKITLDRNNSEAVLTESALTATGANKFIRVWESDGTQGTLRVSWTTKALAVSGHVANIPAPMKESHWHHMEFFADRTVQEVWTKVDGVEISRVRYPDELKAPGHSPTIGLIGFDASVELMQSIWLDDIYLDSSFKRLVLADEALHENVTHEEVQYYTNWTDKEISFDLRIGGLDRRSPIYLYLYSSDGTVKNEAGIELLFRPLMSSH